MDAVVINQLNRTVERALIKYEPRINVNEVEFDISNAAEGTLLINLDYTIKSVNVRTNAVFPFYLKEGTHITDM
jgi:phage baseplate assembly protein W